MKWNLPKVQVTPAMLIALLALGVALSGPAYAAAERLAAGTVGTAQLQDGAVTTRKLHNNAVTSRKIANGTVGVDDLAAAARSPRSVSAADGGADNIPAGAWTTVLQMALPAGNWILQGKGIMTLYDSTVTCDLVVGDQIWDRTSGYFGVSGAEFGFGDAPMSLISTRNVTSTSQIAQIRCISNQNTPVVKDTKLVAIAVR